MTETISSGWGGSYFEAKIPVVETETFDRVSQNLQENVDKHLERVLDEFDRYISRRYQGYVGMGTEYEVLCNDNNCHTSAKKVYSL